MREMTCPGLPADWVNAWLAAVGATRLAPRLRLRWTLDSVPRAVLCAVDADPARLLADAWPTRREVEGLSIARTWGDTPTFARKVPIRDFVARARAARAHLSSWTISSTMTDLDVDGKGEVAHARFDPPAPKGLTMHDRLVAVYDRVTPTVERLAESLDGKAARVKNNGLGFDITRLASQADTSVRMVDPVMEVLAFLGLAFCRFAGPGRIGTSTSVIVHQSSSVAGTELRWQTARRSTRFFGRPGRSYSISTESTPCWTFGTGRNRAVGKVWGSAVDGERSGTGPRARNRREAMPRSNSDGSRRDPHIGHRALRVLPAAVCADSLRWRLGRQRPYRARIPCSPPGRRGQGSPGAWEAGPARNTPVVREAGSVRPGRRGRIGRRYRSPGGVQVRRASWCGGGHAGLCPGDVSRRDARGGDTGGGSVVRWSPAPVSS